MQSINEQQEINFLDMLAKREQALRDDIARELALQEDHNQIASDVPDPGDQSFANLSVDLGNASVARDWIELRAIELARKKIANGTYGACSHCGEPIPVERLKAMPAAERCAPCQAQYEHSHADGLKGSTL